MKKAIAFVLLGLLLLAGGSYGGYLYMFKWPQERDFQRIKDLRTIQKPIEYYFMDNVYYPPALDEATIKGIEKTWNLKVDLPHDPKEWQTIHGCKFWYQYKSFTSSAGIKNGNYILSTCFETMSMTKSMAESWDGGSDPLRYEIGQFDAKLK